ncbi:TetR/AcrR family transcriptional regulator [Nocardia sp. NBC_01009]|uniref:TetR/AcrR family transcriptional regulator n=1 Tax=Nocardia sp. NBC_01009 TaxID=2975996 RepID=UPI00386E61AF|nr:TetR/AcrR family transcriptional regulator [Nocardia sp. NBC_01009]
MGNREDLLAGARKAILERGVAKTTARDIATAAGVSLAAIGYHFGSKERLITEALAEALGSGIGDSMEALIRDTTGKPLLEAFAQMWDGMPEVLENNREGMLASLENLLRVARTPESQEFMTDSLTGAYADIAHALQQAHPELDQDVARAIAELYFVLTQGLGVLWMITRGKNLPDGARLTEAIAVLAQDLRT